MTPADHQASGVGRLRALVSIHDVMPTTMSEVEELIGLCARHGIHNPTLLIVPGLDWSVAQIESLRQWQRAGCLLAGHGWQHRCDRIRGLRHRIHSCLLSRDVAEHLSRSPSEIIDLMQRCAAWFSAHDFEIPVLYVPPAWALGSINSQQMRHQPFQLIETLFHLWLADSGERQFIPLLGFEADTRWRQCCLACLNWITLRLLGKRSTVRVSIHPFDHRLLLSRQLSQVLSRPWQSISYSSLPLFSAQTCAE